MKTFQNTAFLCMGHSLVMHFCMFRGEKHVFKLIEMNLKAFQTLPKETIKLYTNLIKTVIH